VDPRLPDVPVSKKPPKCAWVRARARRILGLQDQAGRILFEVDGVPRDSRGSDALGGGKFRSRRSSSRA
jgi:hypothetical protein